MNRDSKILIVGHDDLVENALTQYFQTRQYRHVFSSSAIALNPTIQAPVYEFFAKYRPEYVFLTPTRSGGIEANQRQAGEFIYHNLESQNNVLYASYKFGVKKVFFFASSCVYPKQCPQPIKPEYLLTAPLEKTSEPYAIAKIAGIKLCQAFRKQYGLETIVAVPATVYGPRADVRGETAHVLGALIGKFADAVETAAKEVVIWGTGRPRREFLYIDDFVEASVFLMNQYQGEDIIHIGCGCDVMIKDLAEMIKRICGFQGEIIFDETKPDGTMQKLLDNASLTRMGWKAKVTLEEGIRRTYEAYHLSFSKMEPTQ